MIRRYLEKYKDFICVADACEATCCSGWEIEIDEEALERYQAVKEDSFQDNINYTEACFCQRANGDCAFLNSRGLCDMILQQGEDMLCDTCRLYPRHIEEFKGVREYSLSVSCPEAAKELLTMQTLLSFTEEEDDAPEDESLYEDYDQELYDALVLCREYVLDIVQNTELSFDEKCNQILEYMKNKQYSLYDDEAEAFEKKDLLRQEYFQFLFELEPLQASWTQLLEKSRHILFGPKDRPFSKATLESMVRAFDTAHPAWQRQCENLLYYFLFTYMCGAVYDDYVYAMSAQAIYNTYMIKLLWVAAFQEKGKALTIEEQAKILYKYSRELENSAENVILLEQILDVQM
ncbi:MAG: flagellin lysine-N-methylase [Lachnospiraceae bacterium]|nr:flagellin lysine-N-methylase [Lachnospiraceae bacterium]